MQFCNYRCIRVSVTVLRVMMCQLCTRSVPVVARYVEELFKYQQSLDHSTQSFGKMYNEIDGWMVVTILYMYVLFLATS